MEVSLRVKSMRKAAIITCPQGIPNYESADLLEDEARKVLRLTNDQMVWAARGEQRQGYLGVLSDARVTLYPLILEGTLEQLVRKQQTKQESKNSSEGLTNFQQRKLVAQEFGTNKSRRKMKQMESNVVQEENIEAAEAIKERFEAKQEQIKADLEVQADIHKIQMSENIEAVLPEHKIGKVPVNEIYDIESIVSVDDLEKLDTRHLQVFISQKNSEALKLYNPYIQDLMQKLAVDKESKQLVLKYVEYLNLLLKFQFKNTFKNTTPAQIAKELKINDVDLAVPILEKFFQITKGNAEGSFNFNKSKLLKDKYINYIIVLSLFISKFEFNAAPLAKQLKLDLKKMGSYCSQCGCKVIQSAGELQVKLKPFS